MDEKDKQDTTPQTSEPAATEGALVGAAKAIGAVVGKAAALVGADAPVDAQKKESPKPEAKKDKDKEKKREKVEEESPQPEIKKSETTKADSKKARAAKPTTEKPTAPPKEGLYKAEYVGSGTFKISKPKRKKAKQRQSALKAPKRRARK